MQFELAIVYITYFLQLILMLQVMTPSIEIRFLVIAIATNRTYLLTNYFHIIKVIHSIVVAQLRKSILHHPIYLFDLEQWWVELPYNILICYEIHVWNFANQEKTTSRSSPGWGKLWLINTPKYLNYQIFFHEEWKYILFILSDL